MKIRNGFVSNSSSSSFAGWGITIDNIPDEYWLASFEKEFLKLQNKKNISKYEMQYLNHMSGCDDKEQKIQYAKNYIFELDSDIVEQTGSDGDFYGIPLSWFMKNKGDIRLCDINDYVAQYFNVILKTNLTSEDIEYYEEGWYNG